MKSRLYVVLFLLIVGIVAEVRGGDPLVLDKDSQQPKVLQHVYPVYPPEAKEQKIQGKVVLEALINEKGDVVEVKTYTDKEKAAQKGAEMTQAPDPLLVKAAIDAVKQWKYEPYRDASGKLQPVRFQVTINFKLK